MKTRLENLPPEIRSARRFFPIKVVGRKKIPCIAGWTDAKNLMTAEDAAQVTGWVAFLVSGVGVESYALLDFDHVLDSAGRFVNGEAERTFNDITTSLECFAERSVSGDGLHVIVRPTPGKFPDVTNSIGNGILPFDAAADSKLEIFYGGGGHCVLLTGDLYECEKGAGIASGAGVDEIFSSLLKQIKRQAEEQIENRPSTAADGQTDFEQPELSDDEKAYDIYRAKVMLRVLSKIDHSQLSWNDYIKVLTVCKNLGLRFEYVDKTFSAAPGNGGQYNAEKNWKRWQDLGKGKYARMGIGVLAKIAQRFGYSERQTRLDYESLKRHDTTLNSVAESTPKPNTRTPALLSKHKKELTVEQMFRTCRENFPLKDFIEGRGGNLRGLTLETLTRAGCVYNPEYEIAPGVCRPCILLPFNVSSTPEQFAWFWVDDEQSGLSKGAKRRPYIASRFKPDVPKIFIVESELDALSVCQAWGKQIPFGVWAAGGAEFGRSVVIVVEKKFGKSNIKPFFVVLFNNTKAGEDYGDKLVENLRARGYSAEQDFLAGKHSLSGSYTVNPDTENEFDYFQPIISANAALQHDADALYRRLKDIDKWPGLIQGGINHEFKYY